MSLAWGGRESKRVRRFFGAFRDDETGAVPGVVKRHAEAAMRSFGWGGEAVKRSTG
jgi:hypothetical protein